MSFRSHRAVTSIPTRGRTVDNDIWGRIFLDEWRGESHPHVFCRDDGRRDTAPSAASYFEAPRGAADRQALDRLTGHVLDLGCGAGSYTRYLESRGCTVTAVDSSPGAIVVCRERGCQDARVIGMDEVGPELGTFDAIVCMGNTLGAQASPETMPQRLRRLASVLVPGGVLVASVIDPLTTSDPGHLAYHASNRRAGRAQGLTRLRMEYRGETSDWWELWMPTGPELEAAAEAAGWTVTRAEPEGISVLYEIISGSRTRSAILPATTLT